MEVYIIRLKCKEIMTKVKSKIEEKLMSESDTIFTLLRDIALWSISQTFSKLDNEAKDEISRIKGQLGRLGGEEIRGDETTERSRLSCTLKFLTVFIDLGGKIKKSFENPSKVSTQGNNFQHQT